MTRDDEIVRAYAQDGVTVPEIAGRWNLTKARVYQILKSQGVETDHRAPATPRPKRTYEPAARPAGGAQRRFLAPTTEVERSYGLRPDHEAVVESRTLFPSRRVTAMTSPRYLVDGKNNSKIGGMVQKGPWKDLPVYTLTLEERATCPRSCAQFLSCYGNAMPYPRRADAFDEDFIPALAAEVVTVYRQHPEGMVVRLHVLGDFYSVKYVRAWAQLMDMLPNLRVYGYTARRIDLDDEASQHIAAELAILNAALPDRWVIRTSHTEAGPGRTIVVHEKVDDPAVIMCPAQAVKEVSCGSCALCWSPSARDKTIAFLLHGMKRSGRRTASTPVAVVPTPETLAVPRKRTMTGLTEMQEMLYEALLERADEKGLLSPDKDRICVSIGASRAAWFKLIQRLNHYGLVRLLRAGAGSQRSVYQVFREPQDPWPPVPMLPLPVKKAKAEGGVADPRPPSRDAVPVVEREPDAPLMRAPPPEPKTRKPYIPTIRLGRQGQVLNPWIIGTAHEYDIGTPEERIESVDEAEKRRIAEQYGATFKTKAAAE